MPHDVFDAMNDAFRDRSDWRVVTDVGQHQMWAAQLLDWSRPRTHITSGGAGTMGFSLPAAMGAAIADPTRTVWVVVGDGGFQMTSCELATIAQEGLTNVKVAIVNNGYLGMVRQWQQLFEGKRYSGTPLTGPDFAKLAEAHGLRGMTVEHAADAPAAIAAAWKHQGCVVIDFRVEREANVFPDRPRRSCDRRHADGAAPTMQRLQSPYTQSPRSPLSPRPPRDPLFTHHHILRRTPMAQHTLIALLQDRAGVLHRTVTLLRRRGFNIASLAVGRSEVPGISRMTLVVDATDASQVVMQLDRLVEVIGVTDVTNERAVQRETALAKIVSSPKRLAELVDIVAQHGARVLDLSEEELIVQITDTPERVEEFITMIRPEGLAELMRTGRLAMMRGRTPKKLEAPAHYRAQADGAPHDEEAAA